jgi:hypothetical protein
MDFDFDTESINTAGSLTIGGTGALVLPAGTTAQEPTPTNAQIRFNTSSNNYEVSVSNQWYPISIQNTSQTASSTIIFDDMISADTNTTNGTIQHGSSLNWMNNLTGTGAASRNSVFGVDSTNNAIGVITVETGTTTTGRSALTLGDAQILFGYCSFSCEWRVAVSALATVAQNFKTYVGFFDNSTTAGEAVDGVYFKYDTAVSPNWVLVTSNNSTRTSTISTVPIVVNTFAKLRIDVNTTGTSANFYINGSLVGTVTTNIPTGAGRHTGLGWKIEKTAGTTNILAYMDYISVGYTYDTAR